MLDPFLGSGTTAVVAERLGRDWLGIELNPAYRELALERIAADRARREEVMRKNIRRNQICEGERGQEERNGEQQPKITPKVWIASLGDYNARNLHGAWVEADQEPEGIWEGINHVLRTSRQPLAEEWAIFDYEGFGPLRLSEYESVERVSRLGRGIGEHGEAFAVFASFLDVDDDELVESFEDTYLGHFESAAAYANDYLDDVSIDRTLDEAVPESLRPYVRIDTEALARDMELEGSLMVFEDSGGGVFLFHPP